MSEPPPGAAPPPADDASQPTAIARLLDEIRRDPRWREEVAALVGPVEAPTEPDGRPLAAPPLDPSLPAIAARLAEAVEQAGADAPIEPGRPFIGDVWARLRQLIRAEIASYRSRQAVVNGQTAAALQRIVLALDPADPASALGAVWTELIQLESRVGQLERRLARLEGTPGRPRLDALEYSARALSLELEPLGALRATVDDLERRLAGLEGAP
jgi:hypothetical protein